MTDITELAQSEINDALAQLKQISEYPTPSTQYARVLRKYIATLVEALEKAQTINAAAEKLVRCKGRYHSEQNYRALAALFGVTTPDLPPLEHENVHYTDAAEMEIAALRQRITELEFIRASADKVQREFADELGCAGDNESILQAIEDLKVQSETAIELKQAALADNVHLKIELEILESRTVKLPDDEDGQAYGFGKWANRKLPATAGTMTIAYCEDAWRAAFEVFSSAAGIKVEAE